jgi:hypothetical protein
VAISLLRDDGAQAEVNTRPGAGFRENLRRLYGDQIASECVDFAFTNVRKITRYFVPN